MPKLVDVSHQITDGMTTLPGLPEPAVEESTSVPAAAPGGEASTGRVTMVGATGTYVEMPAHRYRDGADLADLDLARVADLPGTVVTATSSAPIGPEAFSGLDVRGHAVLVRTGWDRHWRTEAYGRPEHPYLTEAAAKALVDGGATLVGIDSVGVDDTSSAAEGARPALAVLLAAGIPVVSHLCLLDQLPESGFTFFAVPAKVRGMAAFPVRAFALAD
ncbi:MULTISPECIES: cyclase family protein [Nocardiopsis]|uniref:Cyclase n=1 Tax=Nocardiopsis sinuspersici TaxID=501010 RepID=A0A1V3C037_9ACTN|nr:MULTISPECIES: cyclase family protein [Nocardiopsis]NYH55555.1 kynurenine formamidase [Nocardiopsis sinuspersici]OOC54171.1 cyclase [Nocardiopsis sinuspersici]